MRRVGRWGRLLRTSSLWDAPLAYRGEEVKVLIQQLMSPPLLILLLSPSHHHSKVDVAHGLKKENLVLLLICCDFNRIQMHA